jgi:hypothetical protein
MAVFMILPPVVSLGIGYYLGQKNSQNVEKVPTTRRELDKNLLQEIEQEFLFKNRIVPNVKETVIEFTDFEKLLKDIEQFGKNKNIFLRNTVELPKQITIDDELKEILSKRRTLINDN